MRGDHEPRGPVSVIQWRWYPGRPVFPREEEVPQGPTNAMQHRDRLWYLQEGNKARISPSGRNKL